MKTIRLFVLILACVSFCAPDYQARLYAGAGSGLSDEEFGSLIANLSEEDPKTYVKTNLVSNEASYLHPFPGVLRLGVENGVYLGVAPEQNFTYIAKFRPPIAFIIDIQRKNMLQILMYKALFEKAEMPVQFLSLLLARQDDTIEGLLSKSPDHRNSDLAQQTKNYILQNIEGHGVSLSRADKEKIVEMYDEFACFGGDIVSDTPPMRPTLRDLIFEKDAAGDESSFWLSLEDYRFLRQMHQRNLIVPLVGNFCGPKTLQNLSKWLTKQALRVSVFYVSSVEYHIRDEEACWQQWLKNFDSLPWQQTGIIIRAVPFKKNHGDNRESRDGYDWMTLVQRHQGYTKRFAHPKHESDFAKAYILLRDRKR